MSNWYLSQKAFLVAFVFNPSDSLDLSITVNHDHHEQLVSIIKTRRKMLKVMIGQAKDIESLLTN